MTGRISTNMTSNAMQSNLRKHEAKLEHSRGILGGGSRISEVRDDPIAAGHLVRYQSYLSRINAFENNAKQLCDDFSIREGYMSSSLDIMQRIREIAVTGANGTFQKDDLRNMASEVNEMLEQLLQNANATGPDGNSIFAGTNVKTTSFDVDMANIEGASKPLIVGVKYNGNIETNNIETDEHMYITSCNAGNRTFWAEKQILFGGRNASSWQAPKDGVINVDGTKINITTGDNARSLVAKINDSGASVKASIDPATGGINFETTDTRQLWLEDESGTALNELGIIKGAGEKPPYNLGDNVRISGGSLFDVIIALRDSMMTGDTEAIGGRVLGALDTGIDNLVTRLADSGAQYERAQQNILRNSNTAMNTNMMIAREGDVDFTKAVTDMKMLEYVYQASLSNASKLYQNSLLNYMR